MGMKKFFVIVPCLAFSAALVLTAASQPPGKGDKGEKGFKGDKGFKGGPDGKGPPRWQLGKIMPPYVREALDLTEEQEKKIGEVEKEVKTKVLKILNEDQRKKLEEFSAQGPKGKGPKGDGEDGPPKGKGPKGDKGAPPEDVSSDDTTWNAQEGFISRRSF